MDNNGKPKDKRNIYGKNMIDTCNKTSTMGGLMKLATRGHLTPFCLSDLPFWGNKLCFRGKALKFKCAYTYP